MRHSPLDAEHRALGARMVPFGGWEMPIQYAGVLEEHRACRERAVVFDVSHLGSVRVAGTRAREALQWAFTNDLGRIAPGRAQYTHLLDPDDASVVDDIIVWWVGDDDFLVMPNASNTDDLVAAVRAAPNGQGEWQGDEACTVDDVTAERVVLAVQGPEARALLATVFPEAAAVGRFRVAATTYGAEHPGWVAGTGYTGEDGGELHVPLGAAVDVWRALLEAGVTPAGLGARWTFLSDEDRSWQRQLGLRESTDTVNDPYVPAVFTLVPDDLRIHSAYDGYWFSGRPTMEELRRDLRTIQSQVRSDWTAPAV